MWELLWRTFGWFSLVWFATAALFVIAVQAFLPRAWEAIRANPPRGPEWAYTLWYKRVQVYGTLMAISLGLGAIAAILFLLQQPSIF